MCVCVRFWAVSVEIRLKAALLFYPVWTCIVYVVVASKWFLDLDFVVFIEIHAKILWNMKENSLHLKIILFVHARFSNVHAISFDPHCECHTTLHRMLLFKILFILFEKFVRHFLFRIPFRLVSPSFFLCHFFFCIQYIATSILRFLFIK